MGLAAIYPILLLVMLTKPRVKAACQKDPSFAPEANW